jgi:hypothetical protein
MRPQPRVQNKKAHEIVTTVVPALPGIPRAMVLAVSFVISPVIGLYCHRHRRDTSRQLERQRRGVRTTRLRRPHRVPFVSSTSASIASCSNVCDDRETPLLVGQDDLLSIPASSGPSSLISGIPN